MRAGKQPFAASGKLSQMISPHRWMPVFRVALLGVAGRRNLTMKLPISVGLLLMMLDATATPCDGVGSALTGERSAELAPVIASQIHINEARIVGSLRYSGWYIIHAETPASDPPYLFFNGDPMRHRYVALWSGGAMVGEGSNIERWVLNNAKGIPTKLAACFAYQVTPK
jgi:hypothetical protein